jgi:spore coat protein A
MVTRRTFLRYTAGGTMLTLFGCDTLARISRPLARVPGGTLDPAMIDKYRTPLFIPPVMPRAGSVASRGGESADYYEISMRQVRQQILPPGLPPSTVWGYGAVRPASPGGLATHHAPSLTIEARAHQPVRIKWINELVGASGDYVRHLLPVDPTLHWANPPGGEQGRDRRPRFASTPGPYTGPVPIVTHVHGAVGVGDESDGYAEAWYLPAARDIPAGYAATGTWYDFLARKAATRFGATWGPGFAVAQYPNANRASTLWYHDHTLGMTRLNVYAGPAGFYIVRGGPAGDEAVRDRRSGAPAVLPGPPPREGDVFPPAGTYQEVPILIQDRSFNADGSLFYPDTRAVFDDVTGPYIPDTDIAPLWNPEFFGNVMTVNGNTWPFQTVGQRRYRLRFLNACNARFLVLDFSGIRGVAVWQIGNDGGFLATPVNVAAHGNRVLLAPAERADVIVDFTRVPVGDYVLRNVGPDAAFPERDADFEAADPKTTGQVMQFRVVPAPAPDPTTPPEFLVLPAIVPLPPETVIRPLALLEEMSSYVEEAPAETLLGTVAGDPNAATGVWTRRAWMEPVTENPAVGATEVWEFYNATGDAHPIHVHEVAFEVVDRQTIVIDEDGRTVRVDAGSPPTRPEPSETGRKDTVVAYPGQVTRVRARFQTPGQFMWHCHILEHEDNEMMRPYRIGPVQPGQPDRPA